MKKKLLFLCLIMCSCVNVVPPVKLIDTAPKPISVFPVKPNIAAYSRKPILEAQGTNYLVSDEFLDNSLKYKSYSDKIDDWKKLNTIK